MSDPTLDLPFAFGEPIANAQFKQENIDFVVTELLGYEAEGEGENLFLTIQKQNMNTQYLVRRIAKFADVPRMDVGYAGLKDKNAITTQTFSVRLPGMPELNWSEIEDDEVKILNQNWSRKKIRRGSLKGNHFKIRLKEISGDNESIEKRLDQIKQLGFPNYFGSQRFGREGDNLVQVLRLFNGEVKKTKRDRRSMLISSARSHLFNQILAKRVEGATWDKPVLGDVMLLAGSESQFLLDKVDDIAYSRCLEKDIHPSGLMAGQVDRTLETADEMQVIESGVMSENAEYVKGIIDAGLNQDRRALRVLVDDLDWQFEGGDLLLQFSLKKGSYATALLRELIN